MSPEHKKRRDAILLADDESQHAVVELLSRFYVEEFPQDVFIGLCRGQTLTKLCRYAEADAVLKVALHHATDELKPFVWSAKADSFVRRGHFKEAERCYESANELLPNETWILIKWGHTAWMRGDLKLAEALLREAAAIEGEAQDIDEALFNLGGVLVALDNLLEAAECYRKSAALDPNFAPAQERLEDVKRAISLQQLT